MLVVTACTATDHDEPLPSVSPSPSVEPQPSPEWPTIAEVDPSGIAGLSTYTASENAQQVHVVVPQLAEHEAVSARLHEIADDAVASFLEDYAVPSGADGDTPSWLSGTWSATSASEDILGFMLSTTFSPGASTGTTAEVIWYNPEAGALLDWRDLLTEQALPSIADAVVERLQQTGVDADVDEVRGALSQDSMAVGFTDHGALYLGFDSHTIAAGAAGAPAVALEDPSGRGWLSDVGEIALAATLDPQPGAVPQTPQVPARADVDCTQVRCVALTFDDGPSAATTAGLLDLLAAEDVPATFFVLGSQAQAFPELVARQVADGHEVGNHSWQHPDLSRMSAQAVREELQRTSAVVESITGVRPVLVRPPYGATSQTVAGVAAELGMAQAMWNIDTLDWQHRDPAQTVAAARQAGSGSIVLMHDIHPTTIEAVPSVITGLREAGFTFVTASDLLGQTEPGQTYRQGSSGS